MCELLSVRTPSLAMKSLVSVYPASGIVVCKVRTPSNGWRAGWIDPGVTSLTFGDVVSFFLLLHAPSISILVRTRRSGETLFRI